MPSKRPRMPASFILSLRLPSLPPSPVWSSFLTSIHIHVPLLFTHFPVFFSLVYTSPPFHSLFVFSLTHLLFILPLISVSLRLPHLNIHPHSFLPHLSLSFLSLSVFPILIPILIPFSHISLFHFCPSPSSPS